MVSLDGVDANLKMAGTTDADFARWDALFIAVLKLCAAATQMQQHCDRMPTYHTIKVPDEALKKVTQAEYEEAVNIVLVGLQSMKQYLTSEAMFLEFVQAIAILVRIILPKQSVYEVQAVWRKIGAYGGEHGLAECFKAATTKPTDAQFAYILDKVRGPLLDEAILNGEVSDEFMRKHQIPCGGLTDVDGFALRRRRMVLLSHPEIRARILEKVQAERAAAARRAARKEGEVERKARQAKHLIVAKPLDMVQRRERVTESVKTMLRTAGALARGALSVSVSLTHTRTSQPH